MISRKKLANAIRILSIDAIEKANSGHPGTPMGMADIAEVLWRDYINHNPINPQWINRDRFILSNGHASMLLYSILHLTGYDLSMEEIKKFRQLNSKTPGHPECNHTKGIEVTTGPLGQGIANAVGLAIAERTLSSQFNRPGFNIIDHYTYVFLGDGCMMEGISHEVCSLAGTMKLGKLILFYDDNGISIDGNVKNWFNDDTALRFQSYGWHIIDNIDGHDSNAIKSAINIARSEISKPSLLICKTIIAFGSPNKAGTNYAHGKPLGNREVSLVRKKLNWKEPPFVISEEIYKEWNAVKSGAKKEEMWNIKYSNYKSKFPELAYEFERRIHNRLPIDWNLQINKIIKEISKNKIKLATREASQIILEKFISILPELIGGSADLSSSNLTMCSKSVPITDNPNGNYIHYGVREFGMTSIGNGIARYGGFIPYTSTFLTFLDYACSAVRMASLMKVHHIMIYTHDSIGVGEDGPTHQPVEQLSNLRMIPNMSNWRPCDQIETVIAWKKAIERRTGPTSLILSRQKLVPQNRTIKQINDISKGGYILMDCSGYPQLILIATGSEVELAVNVYRKLNEEGYKIRVVSLPSTDVFDLQDEKYKESVLPKKITSRIVIEAGATDFWYKYVGLNGEVIGIKDFGKSAPSDELFELFGFNTEFILKRARYFLY